MVMDTAAKNPTLSLRDTAMFAVAASLGLRAGDIVRLTLSDIDWIHHEIHFVQNKTGVELHLPLEASVGNAIANYILHERPKTQSRALFIRSRICNIPNDLLLWSQTYRSQTAPKKGCQLV